MTSKPLNLVSADVEKADKLIVTGIPYSPRGDRTEYVQFIKHIEENYELYEIPLKFGLSEFLGGVGDLASNYYRTFLRIVASKDPRLRLEYRKKSIGYFEYLIARFEKGLRGNSKRLNLGHDLLLDGLLEELLDVFDDGSAESKQAFLHTYHRRARMLSVYGGRSLKSLYEDLYYGSPVAYFFNSLISDIPYVTNTSSILRGGKEIFGDDPKFLDSYITALSCADDARPILILGETGTGKELLANIIHNFSDRRANTLYSLDCGQIPESIFDTEVSGVIKGAGTDIRSRLGAFLSACSNRECGYHLEKNSTITFRIPPDHGKNLNSKVLKKPQGKPHPHLQVQELVQRDKLTSEKGEKISDTAGERKDSAYEPTPQHLKQVGGTLFLDEISSISPFLQGKLLRIIQENEVRVVGEDRTRAFNVKLICASNKDLYKEVKKGNFKSDLYYRISGCVVQLPPLREMKQSIVYMAESKIISLSNEMKLGDKIRLGGAAKKKLIDYAWPGNIRELENILYRALIRLRLENRKEIQGSDIELPPSYDEPPNDLGEKLAGLKYNELEALYIDTIYNKTARNITKTAELAGFGSRAPVYKLLKKYDIR